MVSEVAKKIKAGMKGISSQHHNTILLDITESVKNSSWESLVFGKQSTRRPQASHTFYSTYKIRLAITSSQLKVQLV